MVLENLDNLRGDPQKDIVFQNTDFLLSRCDPDKKENRRLLACSVSCYLVLLLEKSAVAFANLDSN